MALAGVQMMVQAAGPHGPWVMEQSGGPDGGVAGCCAPLAARRGTLWQRQGPTILLALATPLLLADLTRHCLQGEAGAGRRGAAQTLHVLP